MAQPLDTAKEIIQASLSEAQAKLQSLLNDKSDRETKHAQYLDDVQKLIDVAQAEVDAKQGALTGLDNL